MAGADDRLTGLAPVKTLATRFPAVRVAVIVRCGHYPWLEQPGAFRQTIDAFLDEWESTEKVRQLNS